MSWTDFSRLIENNDADPAHWAQAIEGNPNTPAEALGVALHMIIEADNLPEFQKFTNIVITLATLATVNTDECEDVDPNDPEYNNKTRECPAGDGHAYERDTRDPVYWRTNQTDATVEFLAHERTCNCPLCNGQPPDHIDYEVFLREQEEAESERLQREDEAATEADDPTLSSPATVLDHWFGPILDEQALYLADHKQDIDNPALLLQVELVEKRYEKGEDGVYRPLCTACLGVGYIDGTRCPECNRQDEE